MKISNIQTIKNYTYKKNHPNKQTPKIQHKDINLNFYPAFLGGYSLNLSKINENLKEEQYPPDIYESVQNTLKQGNPQNKTLYDIHFEKYEGVLDCYSLDELKEKYPEFKNVISIYDTEGKEGSFIRNFIEGKSEVFQQDEDLTLQLIKLYWGQGFSLNDLSKHVSENLNNKENFNLYYTMVKKLNIPLMNGHYAHLLKFSNKEYNKNLTEKISIKIKEAKEAKKQKEEGEPVVIPEGNLSKAHKKHISENLEHHFRKNPDKIYRQTRRQIGFLEQNPEFKDEISEAMIYAWNKTQEGLSVKKHLSKFMKKNGGLSEEELALKTIMPSEKISALELFWIKNPWAREKFSIAVNKGWDYAKNYSPRIYFKTRNDERHLTLNLIPTKISKKISAWTKTNGMFIDENVHYGRILIDKDKDYTNDKKAQEYTEKIDKTVLEYEKKFPKDADLCAGTLQLAIIDFENDLKTNGNNLPDIIKNNPEILNKLKQALRFFFNIKPIYENVNGFKVPISGMDYNEFSDFFLGLMQILCIIPEGYKVAEYLNDKIDKVYDFLSIGNQFEIDKILTN